MPNEGTRYLVVLQLGNAQPERLAEVVQGTQSVLEQISTEPVELAFRSATADIFGYLLRTKFHAGQINGRLESPSKYAFRGQQPFLDNKDAVLVVEVGEDFRAGVGFTRVGTWLQHH